MFNDREMKESRYLSDIDRNLFRGMRSPKFSRPYSTAEKFLVEWAYPMAGGALFGIVLALMIFFSF